MSTIEGVLKSEEKDCAYVDIPEFITNIKQEISEEDSEFVDGIKIKQERVSKFEEQLDNNNFLDLDHVKTDSIKNENILDGWGTSEEKFDIKTEEVREIVKGKERRPGSFEGSNRVKWDEVDIKEKEEGSGVSPAPHGEAKATKIPKRGLVHRCPECNYHTTRKNHLNNHMVQHLKDGNMLQCHKCQYQTSHRGNFVRHVQKCKPLESTRESTCDPELLKCTNCEYETFDYRNLSRHVLRHKSTVEVKMHRCSQCEYQTKYKSNLNLHYRRHKRRDQLKVLTCPECEYRTFDKNNLDLHISRHESAQNGKSHKCAVCGYITMKKSHLKIHALRHKDPTEIQMFQCPLCSYQAIRKCDLNRHVLRHGSGGERQYVNGTPTVMKRLTKLN